MTHAVRRRVFVWLLLLLLPALHVARVEAGCSVNAEKIRFGSYDVFSPGPLASTGTITYRCEAQDRQIRIELDQGQAATYADRHMLQLPEKLNYNLYLDAAGTRIWGNGLENTQVYQQLDPGTQRVQVPVFGVVPANQDISPGTYRDRLTVIVLF